MEPENLASRVAQLIFQTCLSCHFKIQCNTILSWLIARTGLVQKQHLIHLVPLVHLLHAGRLLVFGRTRERHRVRCMYATPLIEKSGHKNVKTLCLGTRREVIH